MRRRPMIDASCLIQVPLSSRAKRGTFKAAGKVPRFARDDSIVVARSLRLLLPAAGGRLLPVHHRVARRLVRLPAFARFGDGGVVAAVEQFEAALVVADLLRARA